MQNELKFDDYILELLIIKEDSELAKEEFLDELKEINENQIEFLFDYHHSYCFFNSLFKLHI